jgi:ubiquinone/menaquinone biosynthesis C-methylase UbiE
MDVQQIPYGDKHFDLIICNHLLEHVPDDKKAMNELNRVLKDNGTAILQVPISMNSERTSEDFSVTDPKEREQKFGQFDHVRIYGQDYVTRLQSCGLQVTKVNISSNHPKLGLNPEEDIYTVKKV